MQTTKQSLAGIVPIIFLTLTLLTCLVASHVSSAKMVQGLAHHRSSPASAVRLEGGFIQFNNAVTRLSSDQWEALVRQMREDAKMDTVIIQRLGFRDGTEKYVLTSPTIEPQDPRYIPGMKLSPNDPTLSILRYADSTQQSQRPMKVFIGLWMEDKNQWSYDVPYKWNVKELEQYLIKVANQNNKWADLAWSLYHEHPSFRGWYIPHEFWNFPYGDKAQASVRSEKERVLGRFLRSVSDKCKALNETDKRARKAVDRPVAFSPFFNPWQYAPYAGPETTQAVFTSILKNSGIDILMLQDGSGARCLDNEELDTEDAIKRRPEIKRQIVPAFFRAFAAACRAHNIKLWADLEIYKTNSGGCKGDQPEATTPFQISTVDQLKWQFTIAVRDPETGNPYEPLLFEQYVAFDAFHYLNSVVPDGFGAARPTDERTRFFNAYKAEFISKEFSP